MEISVIMPVCNAERTLRRAIDSALLQATSLEVLCVDDGSTDNSADILREYALRDARVRAIFTRRRGPGAARNTALERARGDYIAFLDADDYYAPGALAKMIARMKETRAQVCMANPCIADERDGSLRPYRDMLFFRRAELLGGFPVRTHPLMLACIGCWDKVYTHELLLRGNILFPEGRVYEDAPFGIRACILADKICAIKECVYFYRKNAGGSITDGEIGSARCRADFLAGAEEILLFARAREEYAQLRPGILTYLLRDGLFHLSNTLSGRAFFAFFRRLAHLLAADLPHSEGLPAPLAEFAVLLQTGRARLCRRAMPRLCA